MTPKDYCSKVCGSACCRCRPPFVAPARCPKLGEDGLCKIYDTRLGFTFRAWTFDGKSHKVFCQPIGDVLGQMSPDLRAKCCYEHPELLDDHE